MAGTAAATRRSLLINYYFTDRTTHAEDL